MSGGRLIWPRGKERRRRQSFKRSWIIVGLWGASRIGVLAHLQMGRALALSGEKGKAKNAYEDFFEAWKEADSEIPILKRARAEYMNLASVR
jgi:hypothetical protein